MKNISLYISSVIFLIAAIVKFLCYKLGVPVIVSNSHIPLEFSLYASGVFLVLSIWMFVAALIKPKTY